MTDEAGERSHQERPETKPAPFVDGLIDSVSVVAQLSEEGATQFFRPMMSNDLILGAVGTLQFDVVAYRLKDEYSVDALFEPVGVSVARWVRGPAKKIEEFKEKAATNLGIDAAGELVYLAPTRVNLQLTTERWPDLVFAATREHAYAVAID